MAPEVICLPFGAWLFVFVDLSVASLPLPTFLSLFLFPPSYCLCVLSLFVNFCLSLFTVSAFLPFFLFSLASLSTSRCLANNSPHSQVVR